MIYRLTILDDKDCANVIYGPFMSLVYRIESCGYALGAAHPISHRDITAIEIEGPVELPKTGHAPVLGTNILGDLITACESLIEPYKDIRDTTLESWATRLVNYKWAIDMLAVRTALRKAREG